MQKPLYIPLTLAIAASFVAVLACATAPEPPAAYERGTFTRPPPAPRRPGVGAPTYDPRSTDVQVEPGPRPKPAPHTPQTRREDTIWASGASEPAIKFDWNVPLPENDVEAAKKIQECAKDMEKASSKTLTEYDIQVLDDASVLWRPCWPHSVVLYCLQDEKERIGKFRPMERIGQKHWDALERAITRARQSWAEHCNAAPWLPPMEPRVIGTAKARGVK